MVGLLVILKFLAASTKAKVLVKLKSLAMNTKDKVLANTKYIDVLMQATRTFHMMFHPDMQRDPQGVMLTKYSVMILKFFAVCIRPKVSVKL